MAQDLRTAMGEHRHVFSAQPPVELTQFCGSVSGTCHKKPSQLTGGIALLHFEGTFWAYLPSRPACVSVLPTGVRCVSRTLLLLWHRRPWFSLSNTSSSSANKITDGQTTELRSHTEQIRSTNWSIMDPGADSSHPPPRSDRETPSDALCPESLKMKYFHCTDLKQENMDYKHGANEE